jgi:predicted DNA-binding transcriptional regulator AlpA
VPPIPQQTYDRRRPNKPDANDSFLNASQLRQRYGGVSRMWLHRRLSDPDFPLPQPITIASRRYWRLRDIELWERQAAAGA